MKHLIAIVLKFILVAVILEIYMLLATTLDFGQVLILSLAITLIAYIIGDLIILPRTSNIVATLVDLVLSFFTVILFRNIDGYGDITFVDALVSALLLGVSEWFFHKYMARKVLHKDQQ